MRTLRRFAICALLGAAVLPAMADGAYQNFKAAIYLPVNAVRQLQDPKRVSSSTSVSRAVRFDKVYLETYRGGQFADEASLESSRGFSPTRASPWPAASPSTHAASRAVRTLDYENADDRATAGGQSSWPRGTSTK